MKAKQFQELSAMLAKARPSRQFDWEHMNNEERQKVTSAWHRTIKKVAGFCATQNVNFDTERFMKGCYEYELR